MRIRVHHNLGDLEADFRTIARRAPGDMRAVVRDGLKAGNMLAKDFARESAGRHGKLYHRTFSAEMYGAGRFSGGVSVYSGEYGPDSTLPQGGMSFERGSRNQPPHNDLAKSADIIGPAFSRSVKDLLDEWFWPKS